MDEEGTSLDFTWKIGGAQGEGIDSAGETFALTLSRMGYHVFAHRHYQSLIKGGHTNYKVRVADQQVRHHADRLDLLVALDGPSITHNLAELRPGGAILCEPAHTALASARPDVTCWPMPFSSMASDLGNAILKNTMAIGASVAVLGLSPSSFTGVLREQFAGKGDPVVASNIEAFQRGHAYASEQGWRLIPGLPSLPELPRRHLFMSGNDALALGALAAGCRFLAAYPITPATDIMYRLIKYFDRFGGAVVQAEDELAAINMAIGAAFAGVRAMTSTSGPGFSLMMEALGLAGIAEIPIVVVDVQRGGPSTGLPTKTEQGDLNEMLYGSHGDIPRIVIAPATVEDCFAYGAEAFNLAERYQTPVIVASDMYLGQSRATVARLSFQAVAVDRGWLVSNEELAEAGAREYPRYQVTATGISPRPIPGQPGGRYVALGNEHDDRGYEIEDPPTRIAQVQKRAKKLETFASDVVKNRYAGPQNPDVLLVGWGSTYGPIREARDALQAFGVRAGHLHLGLLSPFPFEEVCPRICSARHVVVVEQAITGQLAGLLKRYCGAHERITSCLRYDGVPLLLEDIMRVVREVA